MVGTKQPNQALKAARARRNWTHAQLIYALRQAAAARGITLGPDASIKRQISRWENDGQQPDELYAPLLCAVYGMSPAELGIAPQPLTSSIGYPSTATASVDELAELSTMDANDDPRLMDASPLPDGWSAPAMTWLIARPEASIARAAGQHVIMDDVASIRTMSQQFAALDFQFGGGFARTALAQFYRRDVRAMLEGRYSDEVGRALFNAAAELVEVLGWTAYDIGHQGAAQRYFVQALRLAQAGGDRTLGGVILANLSHQANYLGQHADAANLARAAQEGARAYATPTAMAMYAAHEARAYAATGDQRAATVAMRDAERYFAQAQPADDPTRIQYFDAAELAGEFAHCVRDLGQADAGLGHVEQAIATTGPAYVRTLGFVRMVRASIELRRGELDVSLDAAGEALRAAGNIKSARFRRYGTDYLDELAPFADVPAVREFASSISGPPTG
jgi:transcriptional regulator with XRE-family HTH domain